MKKTILFFSVALMLGACDHSDPLIEVDKNSQSELIRPYWENSFNEIYWGKGCNEMVLTETYMSTCSNGSMFRFGERSIPMRYEFTGTDMPVYSLYIAPRFNVSPAGSKLCVTGYFSEKLHLGEVIYCETESAPGLVLQRREFNLPLLVGKDKINKIFNSSEEVADAGISTLDIINSERSTDGLEIVIPKNDTGKYRTLVWRFRYDRPYEIPVDLSPDIETDMALDLTLVQLP